MRTELLPYILHCCDMLGIGCTNNIGKARANLLGHLAKSLRRLVHKRLRCYTVLGGFHGIFVAMFVSAYLIANFLAVDPMIPRPNVRQQIVHSMPNMRCAVDIGNSGRNI